MTGASTNPKKLTLKKTWLAWLIVWKYNPIFLFLIWPQLWPFWHFLNPFGAISGFEVRFKISFETYLCKQSTLVLEVQPYLFVFDSTTFWVSFALFGPIFEVEIRFKHTFLEPTNLDYQFLFRKGEVQPYHFVFILAKFGAFLGPSGLFLGFGSGSKLFLGPIYVPNQVWFWKYSPIFLDDRYCLWIGHILGLFCTFSGSLGLLLGTRSGKTHFWSMLMRLSTFVLEGQPYLFVFILPNLGAFLALRGYFWGWGQVQRFFWDPPM